MTDEHSYEADDNERVSRLSSQPADDNVRSLAEDDTEIVAEGVQDDDDAIVREYEERYYGSRANPAETADAPEADYTAPKPKPKPRSYSAYDITDEERTWATVVHACVWLTALLSLLSVGFLFPVLIFVPLVIYFIQRKQSDYVAFHALQAFVLQLLGTVGALTLLTVGGLIWGAGLVIALLTVVVGVGFVLVPLWAIVGVALGFVVIALPILMMLYGTVAAVETYNGRDYRYPFIAQWVDRQLAGGFLNIV